MNPQYTLKEKYDIITKAALKESSRNPLKIVKDLMDLDCVNIHGPEHHFIDGAAFLAAFNNSGGNIDLSACLLELASRASAMPGGNVRLLGNMRFGRFCRGGIVDYLQNRAAQYR